MALFDLGCNYWASHAGMFMWRNWEPKTVEKDFEQLAEAGLTKLRIFPLWPDFQPLTVLHGCSNSRRNLTWRNESPLPSDGTTVDPVMLERLRFVCDCAHRHNIKLIVALVTGWMSGRLFVPPAFQDKNLITDPDAVFYETELIREIITAMRYHPAIEMWEPGNECNCLSAANRFQARFWLRTIVNAIKSADPSRPVAAGMHGLLGAANGDISVSHPWLINDVGKDCDVLTTHPYPLFTPFVGTDPVGSFKSLFHAVCEGAMYENISGRPCIPEEVGTLSNSTAGRHLSANYLDGILKNLLVHGVHSLYWWCSYDFSHVPNPPYTWNAIERELGIFQNDRQAKPVVEAMKSFAALSSQLPKLPQMTKEAVVILTNSNDSWAQAYGAFLLAKQAHFDVEFRFSGQTLPERSLYILPSLNGGGEIEGPYLQMLLERAANGATLFFSAEDAPFSPYENLFGIESDGFENGGHTANVEISGETLSISSAGNYLFHPIDAEVLLKDQKGQTIYTRRRYGKGWIYFLSLPLEKQVACLSHATDHPYYWFYQAIAPKRIFSIDIPEISVTLHTERDVTYAVCINNGKQPVQLTPVIADGIHSRLIFGTETLSSRDMAIYELS